MSLLFGILSKSILMKNLIDCRHFMRMDVLKLRHYHSLFKNSPLTQYEDLYKISANKCFPSRIVYYSSNLPLSLSPGLRINVKKFLRKMFLIERTTQVRRGYIWYSTLQGVKVEEFITMFEMPDTFASWLKMRLMQDGLDFRNIRLSLINAMWEDSVKRAKTLAPFNKNLKNDFQKFYSEFTTILFSYDEAFLTDDRSLCNVLWYYFFDAQCEDPQKLEALISYIRFQVNHLQLTRTKDLKEDEISSNIWTSLKPHFNH